MKRKLFICFIHIIASLLFISNSFSFEYPRYQLECNLDVNSHTLQANQRVTFTNNFDSKVEEIYFHIYPHRRYTQKEKNFLLQYAGYFKIDPFPEGFQTGELQVESVKAQEKKLSYSIEGEDETILKVKLPRPLSRDEEIELEIDFKISIPHSFGRFGHHKNVIALSRWYPTLSVYDGLGWHNYPYYPYHQPYFSDAAYYRLELTLKKDQIVAHTGSLEERKVNPNFTQTLLIETPLPVRDLSLAISPEYKVYSLNFEGIKINSFYLNGDEIYAKKAAEFARDLIRYYGKHFGKYPYPEFSIAPVYLGYGGEEFSNLIFIDTRVYKLPQFLIRYFDFLISHETGHQWWYNLVGSDSFKETFMDEGINSYCLLKYLEDKYGKDAQVMELPEGFDFFIPNFSFQRSGIERYVYMAKNGLDRPVVGELSSFREPSSIFSLTYGKGSKVMGMLNSLVGEENFFKIMQRYFEKFKFKNASLDDFIRIAEEESGQDLDWFFSQWLTTTKRCDYAVGELKDDHIILENRGDIVMPVEIEVLFADGKKEIYSWDGEGKTHRIVFRGSRKISSVSIDPEGTLLDIDRTNNSYPFSVYIKTVPLYFFAYEIPVFLPDDSYNFLLGPELAKSGLGLKASLQKPYDNLFYLSTNYDFNGEEVKSFLGYRIDHLFNKQLSLGMEMFNIQDLDGENDLEGVKLYLRRELWPAVYGISEVNDHLTFYLLRDRELEPTSAIEGLEDIEHLRYRKKEEAILGLTAKIGRYGPYPDPYYGWKLLSTLESAGHFLGAEEAFLRGTLEYDRYFSFASRHKFAARLKVGWGNPSDKILFQLGGDEGLRGYDRKTIEGSRMLLVSLEYRLTLLEDLPIFLLDNIIHLDDLQGAFFLDIGRAWFSHLSASDFKKDAGFGLRTHLNLGAFLERIVIRLDIAQAINEIEEEPRIWLGIGQSF